MKRNVKKTNKVKTHTTNTKKKSIKSTQKIKKEQRSRKIYIDFYLRLVLFTCSFVLFFTLSLVLITRSYIYNESEQIKFNQKSNLDYKVYLKDNDFYEQEYLEKDMLYVASLIDKIKMKFNYIFTIESDVDMDFTYSIKGRLVITDKTHNKNYYKNDCILLNPETMKIENNSVSISKEIEIDYDYYNMVANNFRTMYGINADSKLDIYMTINKKDGEEEKSILENDSNLLISIPLSQKSVNISLDYKNIDEQSYMINKDEFLVTNKICFILGMVLIPIALIFVIKIFKYLLKLRTKKNPYDVYVNKLLKEYDRLIVETSLLPTFENREIIEVDKFAEMLDVRDNLKLPIMHTIISKHNKSYFYIINNNVIYLYKLKSADLEAKDEKK